MNLIFNFSAETVGSGAPLTPAPPAVPGQQFMAQFGFLLQSNLKPISDNLQALSAKVSGIESWKQQVETKAFSVEKSTLLDLPADPDVEVPDGDEDAVFHSYEEEGDETEESELVSDSSALDQIFESSSRQFWIPEQKNILLWNTARNMDPVNNHKEEWSKPIAVRARKFLTSHPSARPFLGPSPDDDAPVLRYKNQKLLEKQLFTLQGAVGAAAAALTHLLEATDLAVDNLQSTAKEYRDTDILITDPREEAAEIFSTLASDFQSSYSKKAANALRLLGDAHNKVTCLRRGQYVDSITSGAEARNMVRRLQPTEQFLFGGDIQKVCKSLKDGNQLSHPLQKKAGFKGPKKDFSFKGTKGGRVDRFKTSKFKKFNKNYNN